MKATASIRPTFENHDHIPGYVILDHSPLPTSSQRLKLHYVDWGNTSRPPLLLLHGGRDHARNWDWVAQALREDYHIIAPDLRGHGDSQWAVGGSYATADYVLDVAQLLDALQLFPITIIGHSLGGAVALKYTGTYPGRVHKVVAIEGLGLPPHLIRDTPAEQRMAEWITEMQAFAQRHPHRYKSLDEAVAPPLFGGHGRRNLIEVAPVARGEIVQSDDPLIEVQQCLHQMRTDESRAAGHEPAQRFRRQLPARVVDRAHRALRLTAATR